MSTTDSVTVTAEDLQPESGGFFDGEAPVMRGRVLYDTRAERFCAVAEADESRQAVTVRYLRPDGRGPHQTPHGTFSPTDETRTVDWPSDGGRYVAK